jgi:hypothetical protein
LDAWRKLGADVDRVTDGPITESDAEIRATVQDSVVVTTYRLYPVERHNHGISM